MSDSFTSAIREKLLRIRADLTAVAATGESSSQVVELDQAKVGRLSRMDALQAQAMSKASVRRREQTLQLVTQALARLDSGDYGDCRACDEPIDRKRLEFDPTAVLCIDCARKNEQRPS
ncbi:MAG: TraR/DksA family transcriptional regulator [Woeseiaceae bacterium]